MNLRQHKRRADRARAQKVAIYTALGFGRPNRRMWLRLKWLSRVRYPIWR